MEAYENNASYHIAKPYIVAINKAVEAFQIWALAHCQELPDGYSISTEGWLDLEHRISEAIADDNQTLTLRLCKEYQQRATAYLANWRAIVEGKAARG